MFDKSKLEKQLKLSFKDPEILKQAFVHRSFINESGEAELDSNERLEFLGDSVLELAATKFLYHKYPKRLEGELTALRSALVRGRNLAEVASKIGLGEFLILSKGEESSGGRAKKYILANVTEALIGAIYLDQGYVAAEKFILENILVCDEKIIAEGLYIDAKTMLQEKAQEMVNITPEYRLHEESGPDHSKNFVMGVYLLDEMIATGNGSSKQTAEQEAARAALKVKGWK